MGNNASGLYSIGMLVVMFAILYFLMIRPQRKREKADQEMRAALKVGDEIVTIGGVVGKIEKITDRTVVISTTSAKNKIEFLKTSIASVNKSSQTAEAPAKKPKKLKKRRKLLTEKRR